jgi:hypothetical protein
MSTKEAVIEMIRKMPDTATVPDIMAELYVRQKIDEGLQQLDGNHGVPHEEATRRLAKWLT